MFKVLFVLVFGTYHGSINADLKFTTSQQCEAAKAQIVSAFGKSHIDGASCVEVQVPKNKMKCVVNNSTTFINHVSQGNPSAHNMDGYPYPVGLECVEE